MIGYGFWQREFGGSPSAIGRSLQLDGHAFDIVGVTPSSFFGVEVGRAFDVVVPLCAEPLSRGARTALDAPDTWFLSVFGRLKGDWSAEKATAQLASISAPMFANTLPTRYGADDARAISTSSWARSLPAMACRRSAATTSRRCGCCSRPPASCCSSPAPISRT